jgi:hypothetical protein
MLRRGARGMESQPLLQTPGRVSAKTNQLAIVNLCSKIIAGSRTISGNLNNTGWERGEQTSLKTVAALLANSRLS